MKKLFLKYRDHILSGILMALVLFLGFTIGVIFEEHSAAVRAPGMTFAPGPSNKIPLIFLKKIENGVLYGKIEGEEARFVVGEKQEEIFPEFEGDFAFSVIEILPNLYQIPAPEGMQFVASKRGKKFWALDAPEAAMISPKNRVFFRDEQDAVESGFERGK